MSKEKQMKKQSEAMSNKCRSSMGLSISMIAKWNKKIDSISNCIKLLHKLREILQEMILQEDQTKAPVKVWEINSNKSI